MSSKTTELDTLVLIECTALINIYSRMISTVEMPLVAGPLSKVETCLVSLYGLCVGF